MFVCHRCGQSTPRLTVDQARCPRCEREDAARYAPKPVPAWLPVWMRHPIGKSLNGLPVR